MAKKKNFQFYKGARHQNYRGWFTIIESSGFEVKVAYDDGVEATVSIFSLLENAEKHQERLHESAGDADRNNFWWTVGAIAARGSVCIKVNSLYSAEVANNYQKATGVEVDSRYFEVVTVRRKRKEWRAFALIKVPREVLNDERFALPSEAEVKYTTIKSEALLGLIESIGLRVGKEQNLEALAKRVPEGYVKQFLAGTKQRVNA